MSIKKSISFLLVILLFLFSLIPVIPVSSGEQQAISHRIEMKIQKAEKICPKYPDEKNKKMNELFDQYNQCFWTDATGCESTCPRRKKDETSEEYAIRFSCELDCRSWANVHCERFVDQALDVCEELPTEILALPKKEEVTVISRNPEKTCVNDNDPTQRLVIFSDTDGYNTPMVNARPGEVIAFPVGGWRVMYRFGTSVVSAYLPNGGKFEVPCVESLSLGQKVSEGITFTSRFAKGIYHFLLPHTEKKERRFEASTGTVNVAVKGTEFIFDVGDTEDLVYVLDGVLEVRSVGYPDESPVLVSAGHKITGTKEGISSPSIVPASVLVTTYPQFFKSEAVAGLPSDANIMQLKGKGVLIQESKTERSRFILFWPGLVLFFICLFILWLMKNRK